MPDGTAWRSYLDVAQFTVPEHDGFWRSESPSSLAYWSVGKSMDRIRPGCPGAV